MSTASADTDDAALLWSFLQLRVGHTGAPDAACTISSPAVASLPSSSAASEPAGPPIRKLYRHVLECVFVFCRMRDLVSLVRVCREWGTVVAVMPSIGGCIGLPHPRRGLHFDALVRSPLWHHIALLDERTVGIHPTATLWPQLAHHLPWLRRVCLPLVCFGGGQAAEDEFDMLRQLLPRFRLMEWLGLSMHSSVSGDMCNRAIAMVAALDQPTLRRVDLQLPELTPAVSLAPLASLAQLETFHLSCYHNLPQPSALTELQIMELRALKSVKKFVHPWRGLDQTQLLVRLLQPGHSLQWTELPGCVFVLEPLAPLLASLPALTHLNAAQRCPDVRYLAQLTMLTTLDVHAEAPVDPEVFVASLRCCTRITDLSLSYLGCTSSQMQQLLPAFPQLATLSLREFAKQESLCCFATPALAASLTSLSLTCIRACPTTVAELSHLFTLRSLKSLRVGRLSDSLRAEHARLFELPSPHPAVSPSSSSSMSFRPKTRKTLSCLADVEVACINHFLDARAILTLARCTRRLMHQAQQPFSFRFAPPLAIDSRRLSLLPSSPTPLQRRLLLSIVWYSDSKDKISDLLRVLTLHKDDLQIVGLSPTLSKHLHPNHWIAALQLPCCKTLRTLRLTTDIPRDFAEVSLELIAAIAALPALSSLTFWPARESWQLLKEMPSLTDVCVTHYQPPKYEASLGCVAACSRISSLTFTHSYSAAVDVARMLCSPPLGASLRSLTLERLALQPINDYDDLRVADWAACFPNLAALETLRLFRVVPASALLAHLCLLKSLRLLECSTDCANNFHTNAMHLPDVSAVGPLLASMPNLRVRVVVMFAACPDRELAAMRALVQRFRNAPDLKSRFTLKMG